MIDIDNNGLYALGLHVIKNAHQEYYLKRAKLYRIFKNRWKNPQKKKNYFNCMGRRVYIIDKTTHENQTFIFQQTLKEYRELHEFLHTQNVWFDLYGIECDYFIKLLEENEHERG